MDDVGKIRYLIIERTGGRKLKRPVPKDVQHLAGQKNFVHRITASTAEDIKLAAHAFGLKTGIEIARLRKLLAAVPETDLGTGLHLTDGQVEDIARRYFASRDRQNIIDGSYTAPSNADDHAELISDAAGEAEEAQRELTGEFRTSPVLAVKVLADQEIISIRRSRALLKNGWPYELATNAPFTYLCRLLEQADLLLAERKYRSLNRGSLVSVRHPILTSGGAAHTSNRQGRPNGKTLADLKSLFLSVKRNTTGASRQEQFKLPFRVLEEHFGADCLLSNISREEARRLQQLLPRIPAHATKRFKGKTLAEAADEFQQENGKAADRYSEADKHLRVLAAAFKLAVDDGWLTANPFQGVKIDVPRDQTKKYLSNEKTYRSYSVDQLNKLFSLPLFTGCVDDERNCHKVGPNIIRRHRYWAPIIALWTGMRMNEILQLEKADFQTLDGIDYVHVTDEEHEDYSGKNFRKSLKTTNALRKVPVHPSLVRLGLVDWVNDAPPGRLFPEATSGTTDKPSNLYSRRFRTNAARAGIWVARRDVFHSFRNSFTDALREAEVTQELREAILGWKEQKSMDDRYGAGPSLQRLSKAIALVRYPGLKIASFNFQ